MTPRRLLIWGLVFTGLTLMAILFIDAAAAATLQPAAARARSVVNPFMTAIEFLFAFPLSKFATGMLIVLASLALFPFRRRRALAWLLFFTGLTHLTARLIAGVLKNVFLRARPGEALPGQFFVEGGSSFPSGHAAHFWALFFALAVAFPRLRVPALILALLVSASRVVVNDHFVSDVLASGAIAAFVTAGYAAAMRRKFWSGVPNSTS